MKRLKALYDSPWPLLGSLALAILVAVATTVDWLYFQPQNQSLPSLDPAPVTEQDKP